jgi:hypothetical protein
MSPQPLFDMSQAKPIPSAGAPLFDMSKAQAIDAGSKPASFWDRFKDRPEDAAYNDTLVRELKAAGGAITGIPKAVIQAFTAPPTAEEKAQFQGNVEGVKRIGLGIHRLTTAPAEVAANWYSDAAKGKIPNAYEQALSVAPEAVGQAGGTVIAGKLAESAPAAVKTGIDTTGKAMQAVAPAVKAGVGAVKDMATPENIATAAGGGVGAYVGHLLGEPVGGGIIGSTLGRAFGKVFGKRLVAEINPAELDATVENKPYAGEKTPPPTAPAPKPPTLPDELAAARRAAAPVPPPVSKQLQQMLNFRPSIERIIDDAVPPKGETYRDNLIAKAAVDAHLEQGNVEAAQQVLDHVKEAPKTEPTPETEEPVNNNPYKNHTPEQWKQFDQRLGRILEKVKNQPPKQEAAPSVPTEKDLTPQLLESLRMIQAKKAFVDQNATQ